MNACNNSTLKQALTDTELNARLGWELSHINIWWHYYFSVFKQGTRCSFCIVLEHLYDT